jgi:hypothetical protein
MDVAIICVSRARLQACVKNCCWDWVDSEKKRVIIGMYLHTSSNPTAQGGGLSFALSGPVLQGRLHDQQGAALLAGG